jgi:hypothetical protein
VDLWLISVGDAAAARAPAAVAALSAAGGATGAVALPDSPDRRTLDDALDAAGGRRLAVHGDAAGLAGVLRRLGRRDELSTSEVAALPTAEVPFLHRFGIRPDLTTAAAIAVHGTARTVGLLKDDSGNLVVDHAVLRPWSGSRLWVRAYVDDECLCDGEITELRVDRGDAGGLTATARSGRFRANRALSGRGLSLACDEAAISSDGAARDQPRRKRIWWDEPSLWRLTAPDIG